MRAMSQERMPSTLWLFLLLLGISWIEARKYNAIQFLYNNYLLVRIAVI